MDRLSMTWGSAFWGVMGSEGLTYPLSSSQAQTGLGAWKDTGISVGSCCEGEAEETPAGCPAHGTLQATAFPPSGAGPRALQILQVLPPALRWPAGPCPLSLGRGAPLCPPGFLPVSRSLTVLLVLGTPQVLEPELLPALSLELPLALPWPLHDS